jgi:hypothetical protein
LVIGIKRKQLKWSFFYIKLIYLHKKKKLTEAATNTAARHGVKNDVFIFHVFFSTFSRPPSLKLYHVFLEDALLRLRTTELTSNKKKINWKLLYKFFFKFF